jgi:molybdate transport system ATP-binding protein
MSTDVSDVSDAPRLGFRGRLRYPTGFTLDAAFDAGDGVTALVGPSGAGKSTVLNLIAGLLRPAQGQIRLGDHVLVDTDRRIHLPPERRRIGYVFQDHLLFPHLSVQANLRYGMRHGQGRPIDFERVTEVLELTDLLARHPHTLSGGQRQRVALGRAVLRGPDLLLMDEPLGATDVELKDRVLSYLERAVEEWRLPTLYVTHDRADVRRLADHVVVLEKGRAVASGPATDLPLSAAFPIG